MTERIRTRDLSATINGERVVPQGAMLLPMMRSENTPRRSSAELSIFSCKRRGKNCEKTK